MDGKPGARDRYASSRKGTQRRADRVPRQSEGVIVHDKGRERKPQDAWQGVGMVHKLGNATPEQLLKQHAEEGVWVRVVQVTDVNVSRGAEEQKVLADNREEAMQQRRDAKEEKKQRKGKKKSSKKSNSNNSKKKNKQKDGDNDDSDDSTSSSSDERMPASDLNFTRKSKAGPAVVTNISKSKAKKLERKWQQQHSEEAQPDIVVEVRTAPNERQFNEQYGARPHKLRGCKCPGCMGYDEEKEKSRQGRRDGLMRDAF